MATQHDSTNAADPGQMLFGFAARAMEIYSVADMLAQNIESVKEPGPACSMIASEAQKLNDELFDLALKINRPGQPAPSTENSDGKGSPCAESGTVEFAIPDLLAIRRPDRDARASDILSAAHDHAKHLRKAECRLAEAKALAETLHCALVSQSYDAESFADDVAASIVGLLSKTQTQLDYHDARHSNLFLAYFDRQSADGDS